MTRQVELKPIAHGTNRGAAMHIYRKVPMCDPCRLAKNAARREAGKRPPTLVDAGPAKQRVLELLDAGLRWQEIGDAVGIHDSGLRRMFYRANKRIQQDTFDRIMAVSVEWARGSFTPVFRLERRMQALSYMGWGATTLRERGYELSPTWRLGERVTLDRFAEWDRAYRELGHLQGPSGHQRWEAYMKGWASPLAWGENIDDPFAEPEGQACVAGCGNPVHRRSLCKWHHQEVGSDADAVTYRRRVLAIATRYEKREAA